MVGEVNIPEISQKGMQNVENYILCTQSCFMFFTPHQHH